MILKAYSIWLSEPNKAIEILKTHAATHAARLADFETRLEKLHRSHGQELEQLNSPWFGVLAVLKRGIGFEREYLEWCNWMLGVFKASESV